MNRLLIVYRLASDPVGFTRQCITPRSFKLSMGFGSNALEVTAGELVHLHLFDDAPPPEIDFCAIPDNEPELEVEIVA
jgi:hypothetical protein